MEAAAGLCERVAALMKQDLLGPWKIAGFAVIVGDGNRVELSLTQSNEAIYSPRRKCDPTTITQDTRTSPIQFLWALRWQLFCHSRAGSATAGTTECIMLGLAMHFRAVEADILVA